MDKLMKCDVMVIEIIWGYDLVADVARAHVAALVILIIMHDYGLYIISPMNLMRFSAEPAASAAAGCNDNYPSWCLEP